MRREIIRERSHPTGVRGLKLADAGGVCEGCVSHPTGVRGLKFRFAVDGVLKILSHPTGVRGLKSCPR